jgi:hypothetical protein
VLLLVVENDDNAELRQVARKETRQQQVYRQRFSGYPQRVDGQDVSEREQDKALGPRKGAVGCDDHDAVWLSLQVDCVGRV